MERERIQLLSDPNEWVAVKKTWSWGDMKAIEKAQRQARAHVPAEAIKQAAPEGDLTAIDPAAIEEMVEKYGSEVVSEGLAFSEVLFHRLVVEWSFKDSAGAALPISAENMDNMLSADDVSKILLRCIELGPKKVASVAKQAEDSRPNSSSV